MRNPLIVPDAVGVIDTARDEVAELLISFARSLGCLLSGSDRTGAYIDCCLARLTPREVCRLQGARADSSIHSVSLTL